MRTLTISGKSLESAEAAGLVYVSDEAPGIRRRRRGKGFSYAGPDGTLVRDEETLVRIRSLAIPPAWTDVWISSEPNGHLQATGRDAKGRKQYRYHPLWSAQRNTSKYNRLIAFNLALPLIREQVEKDLAKRGLPREKVLATIVRLLETTYIRIGNKEYAKANRSFGLTTLRDRHVEVSGSKLRFCFRGKSGQDHTIEIKDRRLARIIQHCRDIPGYELFQYLDDEGKRQSVDSGDVNTYLREITGQNFTAKDFRTWGGTLLALREFREVPAPLSEAEAKRMVRQVIKHVAGSLGNRPATCRKYYVHPAVIEAYVDGSLAQKVDQVQQQEIVDAPHELDLEEAALVALLTERQESIEEGSVSPNGASGALDPD